MCAAAISRREISDSVGYRASFCIIARHSCSRLTQIRFPMHFGMSRLVTAKGGRIMKLAIKQTRIIHRVKTKPLKACNRHQHQRNTARALTAAWAREKAREVRQEVLSNTNTGVLTTHGVQKHPSLNSLHFQFSGGADKKPNSCFAYFNFSLNFSSARLCAVKLSQRFSLQLAWLGVFLDTQETQDRMRWKQ